MKSIILCWLICTQFAFGQTNFREGWEASNPIAKDAPFEQKIKVHQGFLEKAVQEGDPSRQLYGLLYLTYDHLYNQDYAKASEFLLKAEKIADQEDNPGWQGWVVHRKAIVSSRLKETDKARQEYQLAAELCGKAGDSLCVAESLEQVSVMYGKLLDFENAQRYHDIAMPLIKKYGGEAQLGAALNNYGNINSWAGRYAQAVPNYEGAIAIYKKLDRKLEMTKAMNNFADVLKYLGRYDEAEKILEECMRINRENNFLENLTVNYANASVLYDSMRDYRKAFLYLDDFHYLKDSLAGAETRRKIAELEIKYETQQKELELEKSNSALAAARRSVEQRTAVIIFGLLLTGIGIWRWRLQIRHSNRELERHRENLANMTRLLVEKNSQLAELKNEDITERTETYQNYSFADDANSVSEEFEVNLYDQHILTEEDWSTFKIYFENAYPGFLRRLRSVYSSLTEAEERLFLFIKLNLSTKETASTLGISPDSVKRTRNRLRKRLELSEEVSLEDFIRAF